LRKLNIKYRIYGGLSFYQRKEIKDLIAYFRLTANHNDGEALKRVINYPKRGIGQGSIDKATVAARANDITLWEVLCNLPKYNVGINAGTSNKISQFTMMVKSFATKLDTLSASDLASEIGKQSGISGELYVDKTPEGVARYDNIQELQNGIKQFTEKKKSEGEDVFLADFLLDVALLTDADNDDEEDNDKVTLMTIHASKGLEFPYVYVVGLEEALFPSQMALNSRSELEEERRLFYVAVTRAEKKCTLSYAMSRYRWGNLISCEPSRFIEEIDENFLDLTQSGSPSSDLGRESTGSGASFGSRNTGQSQFGGKFSKRTVTPTQSSTPKPASHKPSFGNRNLKKVSSTASAAPSKPVDTSKLAVGVIVKHERFGKGKILKIEGEAPNLKATVIFPSSGEKQLLLKYAKLTVLG
jgi:DNA helicase-2/ATP-dependent DNA helicase PcrA